MTTDIHPLAPHVVPFFITPPGETDGLLVFAILFMVAAVLSVGLLYLHLHSIPERMMHQKANKVQFEIVAVLALLALFTHINIFWVAALLLAMITIPDFATPVQSMAESLARMAGRQGDGTAPPASGPEDPPPAADPSADAKGA